jgi:phosphoribosylglycinamide formyltransferase-1
MEIRMSALIRVGVLASGRGSNFEALVLAAAAGDLGPARIACLVTDNPQAGACAVAAAHQVPVAVIDCGARRGRVSATGEAALVEALQRHRVDLVCLAGFMRIVGATVLAAFPGAVLNIHPSLLPSFPGLEAQRQALEHGVRVSGCTVHFVDAGVDSGPIVAQAPITVHDADTVATLSARILAAEHELYPRAVRAWAAGRLRIDGRRVRGADAASVGVPAGTAVAARGEDV